MELLTIINKIGGAAAMINQVANGEATFNKGQYALDDHEVFSILSRMILENIEAAMAKLDYPE